MSLEDTDTPECLILYLPGDYPTCCKKMVQTLVEWLQNQSSLQSGSKILSSIDRQD